MEKEKQHMIYKCKICCSVIDIKRAHISKICVECKSKIEGDYKVYIDEPLGTRREFKKMSANQSMINKSIKN